MLQFKLVNLCSSNYIYIKPIKHYLCVCASLKIPPRSLFVVFFFLRFRPLPSCPIINRATSRAQGQVKIFYTVRQRQTTCCCCSCSSGQYMICKYTYTLVVVCVCVFVFVNICHIYAVFFTVLACDAGLANW